MRVSPEARPPNMKERCEIDLSPGTRAVPESGGERRAVAGAGGAECDMIFPFAKAPRAMPSPGSILGLRRSPITGFGSGHPLPKPIGQA